MINQESLKKDLIELFPKEFFIKHIVKSHNWYFVDYLHTPSDEVLDKLDRFYEIVSSQLQISFHSLQMVGSAKTGYSLSPDKLLHPFHEETPESKSSDIDIAIVSEKWYRLLWDELRNIKRNQYVRPYQRITSSIFRGFINEKDILELDPIREKWFSNISPINIKLQDELQIVHPITYRIYRSWEDLEEYQIGGISLAKQRMEESNV